MKSSMWKNYFLLIVIVALMVGVMYLFQFTGWKKIKTSVSPPTLVASAIAYNKSSDYALLFGGASATYVDPEWKETWSAETWKWEDGTWEKIETKNSPPPRNIHAMAYDENRDEIVLFGGAFDGTRLNDTWVWNGVDWVEKNPEHVPPIRCCHTLAYDPVRKGVILYAGWDGKDTFWHDTWLWNGEDWTNLPYAAPWMSGYALVQYPPNNVLMTASMSWVLTEDGWFDSAIQSPPYRSEGGADYGQEKIIFFGGSTDAGKMNETWMFTKDSWYKLRLPRSPSARFGHVFFYDEKRESFIMFGGADDSGYLNDTWEFELPDYISSIATPIYLVP